MNLLKNTLISSEGGKVIKLPANSQYKTPSITFKGIPLQAVHRILNAIDNAPGELR